MKHKVSELEGALLDAAVALAEARRFDLVRAGGIPMGDGPAAPKSVDFIIVVDPEQSGWVMWSPSRLWRDGGPIIERERIGIDPNNAGSDWMAHWRGDGPITSRAQYGSTPLIAAMRAYVSSKFGHEVDLP